MKRLGMLLVLVSLGTFTLGCAQQETPAPAGGEEPVVEQEQQADAPPAAADEKPAEEKK